MSPRREPVATYRLQLHAGFRFEDAARVAEYVAALGVSHLYLSPPFEAAPGSTHGYDVASYERLSEERGGELGFDALCAACERFGLGLVVDLVPNHMTTAVPANAWWSEVLADGAASRYAHAFAIDWSAPEPGAPHRIVLPILGATLEETLERGDARVEWRASGFVLALPGHALPIAPESAARLAREAAEAARSRELGAVAEELGALPRPALEEREARRARYAAKRALEARLARLAEDPALRGALEERARSLSEDRTALAAFVAEQHYRPMHWRDAPRRKNYRRFFDVDQLVALRVDDPEVFEASHALPLRWVREGRVDGLRIDHVDGLRDPDEYLERLRAGAPDAWILVEKILQPGERLPGRWPVDGTTGYEFLDLLQGLYVDPAAEKPLREAFAARTGRGADWEELVVETKLRLAPANFPSELERLGRYAATALASAGRLGGASRVELERALALLLAHVPVYRTYSRPGLAPLRAEDERIVRNALRGALERRGNLHAELLEALADALLLKVEGEAAAELVWRFQQFSSALAAKAVEDTAFYLYHPLACLDEVGGDPSRFGTSLEAFHRAMEEAARERPLSMLATSTHDTKRGEDVRARIALLSEMPFEWLETSERWRALVASHRSDAGPDPAAEDLFFQTLVGAWPIETERAAQYMLKAAREAEAFTSWVEQDERYEAALLRYVEGALADERLRAELERFTAELRDPGRVNSLSQTLVKLAAPGVPDFYQGTGVWGASLVDPDNRRPVDYERLDAVRRELEGASASDCWKRREGGLPKLFVTQRALALRHEQREAFAPGAGYEPLATRGPRAECAIAFVRSGGARRVAAIAPRFALRLARGFEGSVCELPPGVWRDAFTGARFDGGEVELDALLADFPVALLAREGRAA